MPSDTTAITDGDIPEICRQRPKLALFAISVLGLYLELMLIRWMGTEFRIFAYFQNIILIVCFFGLGLGCFSCRQSVRMIDVLLPLTMILGAVAVTTPASREILTQSLGEFAAFAIWGVDSKSVNLVDALWFLFSLLLTFMLLQLLSLIFVPIGRILGRLTDSSPRPILAYSINVAGSLIGIWLFAAMSMLFMPPSAWAAVAALLSIPFIGAPARKSAILYLLLAISVAFAFAAEREGNSLAVLWSPYQKLELTQKQTKSLPPFQYLLNVNNAVYQAILDLRNPPLLDQPEIFPESQLGYSQYDLPILMRPGAKKMLIVGAGTGNDVAGALRNGVSEVVAVEIDPAIISFGRKYHPEQPYSSPRVRVIEDDARAYFARSREQFDVIAFGLLDSHTTSSLSNARLDHYVYTRESIRQAKALLAPGGVMTLAFEAQRPFIADRIGRVLAEIFGESPIVFRVPINGFGWGGMYFVTGDLKIARQAIEANPGLKSNIESWRSAFPTTLTYSTAPATDDWPYLYLEHPGIPSLYLLMVVLIAALAIRFQILYGQKLCSDWTRANTHFFLLGAAFLLLETQNISKASVALGSTWQVNSVIISGVLIMILLANTAAALFPRLAISLVYAALLGTIIGLYFFDLASLTQLPYAIKAPLVAILTTSPMFFSGIVFIRTFAIVSNKGAALGSNLLGSIAGGLLQPFSFLIGIKALLLIVAALYLGAYFSRPAATRIAAQSL